MSRSETNHNSQKHSGTFHIGKINAFETKLVFLNEHIKNHSDMRFVHLEDITNHYALTLKEWRKRFNKKIEEIYSLGFSESFCRLWEVYLASCEAAFLENHIGDVQMVFARPGKDDTITY